MSLTHCCHADDSPRRFLSLNINAIARPGERGRRRSNRFTAYMKYETHIKNLRVSFHVHVCVRCFFLLICFLKKKIGISIGKMKMAPQKTLCCLKGLQVMIVNVVSSFSSNCRPAITERCKIKAVVRIIQMLQETGKRKNRTI